MNVLVDTDASECYISPHIARRIRGDRVGVERVGETAGGVTDKITVQVIFNLNLQGFTSSIKAYVYDSKFDVILGRMWLKSHEPLIQWKDDSIFVTNNASEVVTTVPTRKELEKDDQYGESSGTTSLNYLISYYQANRCLKKKGSESFLLYVTDKSDDSFKDSTGTDVSWLKLTEEFPSVFQDQLPWITS